MYAQPKKDLEENKVMKYLKNKHYEIAKASEPNQYLVFVPYAEHVRVSRYLNRHQLTHTLRFNHDYSIAIFCL